MVKTYEKTVIVTASINANTPANAVTVVSFTVDPQEGSVSSIVIPKGEYWVLEDSWITSEQTPDGILKLIKNRTDIAVETPPINTMLVSNPSRPRIKPSVFEEHDTVVGHFINLAAVGTGGATVTLYLKFKIFKD